MNEKVNGKRIIIKKYHNIKEAEECNMIFINYTDEQKIRDAIQKLSNNSILTISESENFTQWGGIIRIYSDGGKIRMQINDSAARKEKLKISAKLLNVADVYYP